MKRLCANGSDSLSGITFLSRFSKRSVAWFSLHIQSNYIASPNQKEIQKFTPRHKVMRKHVLWPPVPRVLPCQSPNRSDIRQDAPKPSQKNIKITHIRPPSGLCHCAFFCSTVATMAISSRWSLVRAGNSLWDVISQGWYLGFTAFGGPPVHFKIVRISLFLSMLMRFGY